MKWIIFLWIIISCSFVSASSIRINEVMANPGLCSDAYCEWVELYNYGNNSIDLLGFSLGEKEIGDNNEFSDGNSVLEPKKYAIVTDKVTYVYYFFNFSQNALKLNVKDNLGLVDSGRIINLNDTEGNLVDSFNYSSVSEDYSWSLVNGSWVEQTPTLGFNNEGLNETIEESINYCDWKIEVILDDYIFERGDEVNWTVKVSKNYGEKTNVTVRGYVKDLLSDWQMDYKPWTNEQITNYRNNKYSPNLWEDKFYEIFYNITELGCNETYFSNNFVKKFIMVLPKNLSSNYTGLRINELFPNPEGYDNEAMPDGEWVELYNSGSEMDLEGLGLKDDYGKDIDIFISDSNTLDGTVLETGGYLVVYMNGRSGFLDNNGYEKISLYCGDDLIDRVSYSGNEEGLSWSQIDGDWILTEPSPGEENYGGYEEEEVEEIEFTEVVVSENLASSESNLKESVTGNVIFEDKGEKQKRSALYFFCGLMLLILVYYSYGRE